MTAAKIAKTAKDIFGFALDIGVIRGSVFPADSIWVADRQNSMFVDVISDTDNDPQSFYELMRDPMLSTFKTIFEELEMSSSDEIGFFRFRDLLEGNTEVSEEFMTSLQLIHDTMKDEAIKLSQELQDADRKEQGL